MSKNKKVTNNPDPEVLAKPKRRTFTKEYKKRILKEYSEAKVGTKGTILRREGLYSSHITNWRRQLEKESLKPKKRGPKTDPKDAELSKLEEENKRLRERLKQAELIIEAQKKISQILGTKGLENTKIS